MARKYKIAIADDHILVRKAISRLINSFEGYSVFFEVDNGNELKKQVVETGLPDVVLMDINMPNGNGYDTTSWLRRNYPVVKVLALSMLSDEAVIIKILKLGAKGYILKTMEPEELKNALDAVIKNDFYLPDVISGKIISGLQHNMDEDKKEIILTEKEKTFLQLLSSEMTYKEIAAVMSVSSRMIDGYKSALCERFLVKTRVGLVMYAVKNKLIEISDN
ncbi:MAG: response regulator transcription factor [Chitinophagaceae bacterium]